MSPLFLLQNSLSLISNVSLCEGSVAHLLVLIQLSSWNQDQKVAENWKLVREASLLIFEISN